ncbi:MAG TPA: hypothetical protein VN676_13930 [Steroidobacteraceae bacterium]|nr:hypothetical protein [Steroidobacteraceae bacterium]
MSQPKTPGLVCEQLPVVVLDDVMVIPEGAVVPVTYPPPPQPRDRRG